VQLPTDRQIRGLRAPPTPWTGVRLKYTIKAELCTDRHPIVFFIGGGPEPPEPPGPGHIDVSMELWVPEHRTSVRDMIRAERGSASRMGSIPRIPDLRPSLVFLGFWLMVQVALHLLDIGDRPSSRSGPGSA